MYGMCFMIHHTVCGTYHASTRFFLVLKLFYFATACCVYIRGNMDMDEMMMVH